MLFPGNYVLATGLPLLFKRWRVSKVWSHQNSANKQKTEKNSGRLIDTDYQL